MLLQKLRKIFLIPSLSVGEEEKQTQSILLEDLLEQWHSHMLKEETFSIGTMNNYSSVIKTLKCMPISKIPVEEIATQDLQLLFDSLVTGYLRMDGTFVSGYSHSHILAFSAVLQGAFRYAVYPCKMIQENLMRQVILPRGKGESEIFYSNKMPEQEQKVLTDSQFQSIVKFLEERNNPALLPIEIAYYTGLRLGEVCALLWEDINWQEQYMVIRRSVMMNRLENNRLEFSATKRNKVRYVYFGNALKEILVKAKAEQENQRKRLGKDYKSNYYEQVVVNQHLHFPLYTRADTEKLPDSFQKINMVCLRPDGSYESRRTVSSVCSRLKEQLPGMEHFHFHMLRHTYTCNLLRAGARPKDVQELLGHNDINTTMNVYAHSDREEIKKIVEMLE